MALDNSRCPFSRFLAELSEIFRSPDRNPEVNFNRGAFPSPRKWFTPIDSKTFQIAYEFDYDAGIATNLTNEVIFEVRYDGDGAITPVMVWYERMD